MKIGIFFGGNSREREVSFAGGRTVYDNLDKSLFEAVPVFVDSFNNFILLDWKYIYKGSIRDFYPPVEYLQTSKSNIQIYTESIESAYADHGKKIAARLGKIILAGELNKYMDFAFLALHGAFGEDGTIQGLLEWHGIPYSGSGILPSAVGMHKKTQKSMMQHAGFNSPAWTSVSKQDWMTGDHRKIYKEIQKKLSFPFVIKPANQGSSVGVTVLSNDDAEAFEGALDKAFFMQRITKKEWTGKQKEEQVAFVQKLADIKEGIGLPALHEGKIIYHPDEAHHIA